MNRPLDRSFYIPANSTEIVDGDAVAYLYKFDDKVAAMGFYGKTKKPIWHYRFRNKEDADDHIEKFFKNRQEHLVRKEVAKQERLSASQEMADNAKVGDIYYASWGYNQTNIDFYQILEKKGKMSFMLQKIGSIIAHAERGSDYVMPNPKHTKGDPMLKRINAYGFTLNSFATASPWDGQPKYETAFGYGH